MLRDASEKKKASSSSSSEAFLREQLEAYNKEVKLLKQRIDSLEKENQQLKKSVYDLSFRSSSGRGGTSVGAPFDIDAALEAASAALPPPNDIQANAAATPGMFVQKPSSNSPKQQPRHRPWAERTRTRSCSAPNTNLKATRALCMPSSFRTMDASLSRDRLIRASVSGTRLI